MRKTFLIAALLLLYLIPAPVFSAGFDCKKARSDVEKMICANPTLSKLDERLSAAYKAALQDGKQAESIRQAQKQWLKERNGCSNAACVKQAYETRLATLNSSAGTVVKHDEYVLLNEDLDETTDYWIHIEPDPKVCRLYQENLNYFAHQDVPMSCNRPIAPHLKSRIQEVEWEDLKPADYPELFRQVVLFTSRGNDRSADALKKHAQLVATREYVFRRAKLSLSGKPMGQTNLHGEPDKSRKEYTGKFYIVQYGSNSTDINRPGMPCKPIRGNWPGEDYDDLYLYLVSADMNEVINSLETLGRGLSGHNMRLIDGRPYVEGIWGDASIHLFRLSLTTNDVFLEMLCQYRFETSCRLPGRETFDPDQPTCKPNLD